MKVTRNKRQEERSRWGYIEFTLILSLYVAIIELKTKKAQAAKYFCTARI